MKKILSLLSVIATVTLSMTSCEDVPQPYDTPTSDNTSTGGTTVVTGDYINETFSTSFGSFTAKTVKGTPWVIDYKTAKGTGYSNSTTTPSDAYLISQPVDLSSSKGAYLQFEYILRYKRTGTINQVLITDNYTGDATTTSWTDITGTLEEGSDWEKFYSYKKNIPTEFIGKKNVVIALRYGCESSSATWEVKNLKLTEGQAEGGNTPTSGSGYFNETFATSFGAFTPKTVKGSPWTIDYKTAYGSGYSSSTKQTTESNAYLVSPVVDLSNSKGATLKFEYILRYYTKGGKVVDGVVDEVLITSNYTGDPSTTTWENITGKLVEGTDYLTFSNYSMDIPSSYIGAKKVVVALHYACTTSSSTWEVKNMSLKEK